jgi:hypothetical protein
MTTTYQKLLNKIEAFCNAHLQIKKYKGEFKEQMPNFATLDEKYPIVFVVPNGDTEGLELNQFTLEVYCLDIIQKDRANINTIVSDCHLILKDLYLYFKDGTDLEVDVIGDPTMTPLNNDLLDYAAGWVMTITFEVEGYTVCAIPMNPIPPFTPICQDATVENSDESYTATVASGGTLVLPDITVTDSDGSTFTQPAVQDVTCTPALDADYQITDTDDNVLYSGTIPSGGSLDQTIADSTATLKDTADNVLSTTQILAEGSEDIVAPDATYTVEYLNGTPITSGNILSGGSETIVVPNPTTCADAVVNVNSVFFDNVASGGTLNIQVRKSSGSDLVGSKQGQYWRIGDSTAVLKTTGGATISTTSIKAEESEDITAPDALVRFRYANITTGATFTDLYPIVSGGEKFLYIENSLAQLARAVVDATRPVTTYRLRDSAITLKNTANATLSTTNVPATVNQDITAPDATVENSNATYVNTVVSGGTLVLPDITVTDSDGSTFTQPSVENVVCTAQIKDLFWELNYNGTDDVIYIPATVNNVGTLTSGTGSNVGTITVSTDNVTYGALTFPFTPVNGTTYYFKRSTATVNGTYTMVGTYV